MAFQQAKWDLRVHLDRVQLLTGCYYKSLSDQTGGEKKEKENMQFTRHWMEYVWDS